MDRKVSRPYDRQMAIDARRVFHWDDGAIDRRFALRPVTFGLAAGGPSVRETFAVFELPAKSALAGSMAALLYGVPVLFVAKIFLGFGGRLFAAILGTAAFVGSLATWRIAIWERRHWQRKRERLSDHADPPPWK
jgi:hypothetical protein